MGVSDHCSFSESTVSTIDKHDVNAVHHRQISRAITRLLNRSTVVRSGGGRGGAELATPSTFPIHVEESPVTDI